MHVLSDSLRSLTPEQWRTAYYNIYVYVKPNDGAFDIHTADGALIATLSERDAAFAVAKLNNLEPLSLH